MTTDEHRLLQALCREDFNTFCSKAFSILEPGTQFEYNWHIGLISEHLQAVHDGEIQWLIINEPPRCLKSVQVGQIFPAWEIGKEPHHQLIGASYAHSLAERNVMKTRQLIQSEFYRDLFPNVHLSDDMNKKDYFTTTQNGQYKGTGIGGTITGFGCFVGETKVITDCGVMEISGIKVGINANHCLSFNHQSNILEWKEIEASRTILRDDIYEVTTRSGNKFRCTGNHPIYINGIGYVEAKDIKQGQVLVKAYSSSNGGLGLQLLQNAVSEDRLRTRKTSKKGGNQVLVQSKMLFNGKKQIRYFGKVLRKMRGRLQAGGEKKLQHAVLQQEMRASVTKEVGGKSLPGMFREVCSEKHKDRLLFKEVCGQYALKADDGCRELKVQGRDILCQEIQGSATNCIRAGQSFLRGVWQGWTQGKGKSSNKQGQNELNCSPYRRETLEQRHTKFSDLVRELPYFSSQEDTVVMVERVHIGKVPVYDLQVKDNNNFFAEGILVHNCKTLLIDDPINPKEAVSDTIRVSAINEIRSTLFSRFNKYSEGRMVMIMQRLHDADPTGDLLADGGYFHLKLPAYASKAYSYSLHGKTWSVEEGEYLTPRLDKASLDKLRTDLGEYHFAGQYMQEPVPVGGGEIKPEWFQYYSQGGIKPKEMNIVILVDPSGGEDTNKRRKKLSDFTVMKVIGLAPDNNRYVLDIVRDRLNPTDRIDTLFMLHRKWNEATGRPPKVGYEKYSMQSDIHYIKEKQRQDAYNFPLIELGGSMNKEDRIRRMIPDAQNGRWYLPASLIYIDQDGRRFDLVQEFLKSEVATFPRSRFDDMLDCMTRVYDADLSLVFPKQKSSMVAKAMRGSGASESWEEF